MILMYFLLVTGVYFIVKLILYILVFKFGKFSYNGFSAAGFAYNREKNIFFSTRNAWQKQFGYCHLYDVAAPIFRMIIDTEPVRFTYNNKNWLLTFWKGQYGIVTGAEIGIYCTDQKRANKKTIYMPARDNELLDMGFVLYRKNEEITRVSAKHWWLAIFKIGMFSKPKNLTMDIKIKFLDTKMLNAFLESFKKLGYKEKDFRVENSTFYFTFKHPKTRKVWTRMPLMDAIRQHGNKKNVALYNKYINDVIDENESFSSNKKIIMVQKLIPDIFKNPTNVLTFNRKENQTNAIYLNNNVYSNMRVTYEKQNR